MHAKSFKSCLTLCSPMDCNPPDFPEMRFSGQEYWNGLPCPPPGDLLSPGIKPEYLEAPASQVDSLPLSHWGSYFLKNNNHNICNSGSKILLLARQGGQNSKHGIVSKKKKNQGDFYHLPKAQSPKLALERKKKNVYIFL